MFFHECDKLLYAMALWEHKLAGVLRITRILSLDSRFCVSSFTSDSYADEGAQMCLIKPRPSPVMARLLSSTRVGEPAA